MNLLDVCSLRKIVHRLTGAPYEIVCEAVQEAITRLVEKRITGYPKSWVVKSAVNLVNDHYRHLKVEKNAMVAVAMVDELSPERILESEQDLDLVANIIDELPAKCRTAFLLHAIDRLSSIQISKILKIPDRTARHYIVEALVYCSRKFNGKD